MLPVTTTGVEPLVNVNPVIRCSQDVPAFTVMAELGVTVTAPWPLMVKHFEADNVMLLVEKVPLGTRIVSPLDATVMQALMSDAEAEAAVQVGDKPEQAALADGE